jgi:hypothetical protein
MRSKHFAAVLAGLLAAAAPASASHENTSSVRCAAKTVRSVQVVTTSSEAVVFSKAKGSGAEARTITYACMLRAGPIVRLKATGAGVHPLLAGRFVAYRQGSEFGSPSGLIVQDVRTGRVELESRADGSILYSFVVKRTGSAAWVERGEQSEDFLLYKFVRGRPGEPELLDLGVDFESLRLSADRRQILWTTAGQQKSAPLE